MPGDVRLMNGMLYGMLNVADVRPMNGKLYGMLYGMLRNTKISLTVDQCM